MARKQKKLTRKQRNEQRHAAVSHHRHAKGLASPNEKARQRVELAVDMEPIGTMLTGRTESEQMQQLFLLLAESEDLADEPELEDILLSPLETAEKFALISMEMGFNPETLDSLSEDERDIKQIEVLESATRQLLTDELRQEIISGLDQLRQRLKREGRTAETAKVAALQSFLGDRKTRDMGPMLGLPQEIVRRSLEIGAELMATSLEIEELNEADGDGSQQSLLARLSDSNIDQKLSGLLQKSPGLNKFLEKEMDKIWDDGMDAIFDGELDLMLFTMEEIKTGMQALHILAGSDEAGEEEIFPEPQFTDEIIQTFIAQVNTYLTEWLTPERMDQFRDRLQTILQEGEYPPEYAAFIHMVADNLADPQAIEFEKPFFLHVYMGEVKATAFAIDEADDDYDDYDDDDEDA